MPSTTVSSPLLVKSLAFKERMEDFVKQLSMTDFAADLKEIFHGFWLHTWWDIQVHSCTQQAFLKFLSPSTQGRAQLSERWKMRV